ncbi:MAG TPA: hypothetical protein VHD57_01240 [Vicinamibacterales bacterium]|nr:hypothetical protein [Vicinamibacterales bacterium]
MSPIFVRPVREQLEHDRLIRHLQTKYKKFDVAANVGDEQVAPVKLGQATFFPDLVLTDGRKLAGLVEVESGESVNNLEAMAQWVHFARARVPFHLYVPVPAYDAARRLCEAHQARVTEIWTYRPLAEGFDLVRMHQEAPSTPAAARRSAPPPKPTRPARAAASKTTKARPVARKPADRRTASAPSRPARAARTAVRPATRGAKKPAARARAASGGRKKR